MQTTGYFLKHGWKTAPQIWCRFFVNPSIFSRLQGKRFDFNSVKRSRLKCCKCTWIESKLMERKWGEVGLLNGSISKCVYLVSKVSKFKVFSGLYFPIFELNTDIYSLSLRSQYEYWKIQTRKTSNSGTFHAVIFNNKINSTNTLILHRLWTSEGSKIKISLAYMRKYGAMSGGFHICINWYTE